MKRLAITLIMILLLATPAYAEWFSWDETNTKLHVPLTILMFADYRQTLYNEKHYYRNGGLDGIYYRSEGNKFLGSAPSRKEIHKYFAKAIIACTVIPFVLPPASSYIFQGGVIILEIDVVNNNYSIGAKYFF